MLTGGNVGPKVALKKKKKMRKNTVFASHGNQSVERAKLRIPVKA